MARHRARPDADGLPWHVVAIGASAGGLEAMRAMLDKMSLDQMCVVILQHLPKGHSSLLPELLAAHANLRVDEVVGPSPLDRERVWICPSHRRITCEKGQLDVGADDHAPYARAIDALFSAMAKDLGPRLVGVVLSGMGNDGQHGLDAVRAAGGLAMAQTPASAKFESMPRHAKDAGRADRVGTPTELAEHLSKLTAGAAGQSAADEDPEALAHASSRIIAALGERLGADLSHIKEATVQRRLRRRTTLARLPNIAAYVDMASTRSEELAALRRDLLISVTSFFRDPEVFDILAKKIIPELVASQTKNRSLRLWVPACATGEEAYSLGILVLEELDRQQLASRAQIFATDVDEVAINTGRRGCFSDNIAEDVSAERLQHFFIARDGGFQICRRLRDLVIFSAHDVVSDPPFSNMDFISCRNLLIYLKPEAQQRVLSSLHYGLSAEGFLLLGAAETVAERPDLFALAEGSAKLFGRRLGKARQGRPPLRQVPSPSASLPILPRSQRFVDLRSRVERRLLEAFAPPGVVVDESLDVLHFTGDIGPFLAPSPGGRQLSNPPPATLRAPHRGPPHLPGGSRPAPPTEWDSHPAGWPPGQARQSQGHPHLGGRPRAPLPLGALHRGPGGHPRQAMAQRQGRTCYARRLGWRRRRRAPRRGAPPDAGAPARRRRREREQSRGLPGGQRGAAVDQ